MCNSRSSAAASQSDESDASGQVLFDGDVFHYGLFCDFPNLEQYLDCGSFSVWGRYEVRIDFGFGGSLGCFHLCGSVFCLCAEDSHALGVYDFVCG